MLLNIVQDDCIDTGTRNSSLVLTGATTHSDCACLKTADGSFICSVREIMLMASTWLPFRMMESRCDLDLDEQSAAFEISCPKLVGSQPQSDRVMPSHPAIDWSRSFKRACPASLLLAKPSSARCIRAIFGSSRTHTRDSAPNQTFELQNE